MDIYIVTYWDNGQEPIITVFNDKEAADNCYDYFKDKHDHICIDKSQVYSTFKVI
jgi:hypothetical protein